MAIRSRYMMWAKVRLVAVEVLAAVAEVIADRAAAAEVLVAAAYIAGRADAVGTSREVALLMCWAMAEVPATPVGSVLVALLVVQFGTCQ